jgi:hypothetical protein
MKNLSRIFFSRCCTRPAPFQSGQRLGVVDLGRGMCIERERPVMSVCTMIILQRIACLMS